MHSFIAGIISLILGWALGAWSQSVKQRSDYLVTRLEEIVTEINSLRSLTQDYWINDRSTENNPNEHKKIEAEIIGRFLWLNIVFSELKNTLPSNTAQKIQKSINIFFENSTGGDFGDIPGKKDSRRVQAAYRISAILSRDMRRATAERLKYPFSAIK